MQIIFAIFAIPTRKPPIYTIKEDQDEVTRGKFSQKELI